MVRIAIPKSAIAVVTTTKEPVQVVVRVHALLHRRCSGFAPWRAVQRCRSSHSFTEDCFPRPPLPPNSHHQYLSTCHQKPHFQSLSNKEAHGCPFHILQLSMHFLICAKYAPLSR